MQKITLQVMMGLCVLLGIFMIMLIVGAFSSPSSGAERLVLIVALIAPVAGFFLIRAVYRRVVQIEGPG